MIRASSQLAFAATLLAASIGFAQEDGEETIFDPENPAFSTGAPASNDARPDADDEDEASPESSDKAEDAGLEVIEDPENPSIESIEDPENSGLEVIDHSDQPAAPQEAWGGAAAFQRASFLGEYRTGVQLDTSFDGAGEDVFEQLSRIDLRLEFEPNDATRVVVEGEFLHWWSTQEAFEESTASYEARLGEAYVLLRDGRWTLGMGNLVTKWGATDIIRPGDVVNPVDLTEFSPSGAMEKVPQLTVDLSYSGDGWAAQALLVPFFVPNRMWAYGRDTAILSPSNALVARELPLFRVLDVLIAPSRTDDVQNLFQGSDIPDEGPESVSVGGRVTATAWNADFGLGYFLGWDRTPFLKLNPDVREVLGALANDPQVLSDLDLLGFFGRNPSLAGTFDRIQDAAANGDALFSSEYRRLHTIEADVTRYVGPIGVRADAAFQPARTFVTQDLESIRRPTLSGALGLSYERLIDENDALVLTLEGFAIHALPADSEVTKAFVDGADRGSEEDAFFLFEETTAGVAGALSWTIPYGGVSLQLGGVGLINSGDLLVGGSVQKRWTTYFVTGASAFAFENLSGREDAIGTIFDRNDYVGVEISGNF